MINNERDYTQLLMASILLILTEEGNLSSYDKYCFWNLYRDIKLTLKLDKLSGKDNTTNAK